MMILSTVTASESSNVIPCRVLCFETMHRLPQVPIMRPVPVVVDTASTRASECPGHASACAVPVAPSVPSPTCAVFELLPTLLKRLASSTGTFKYQVAASILGFCINCVRSRSWCEPQWTINTESIFVFLMAPTTLSLLCPLLTDLDPDCPMAGIPISESGSGPPGSQLQLCRQVLDLYLLPVVASTLQIRMASSGDLADTADRDSESDAESDWPRAGRPAAGMEQQPAQRPERQVVPAADSLSGRVSLQACLPVIRRLGRCQSYPL